MALENAVPLNLNLTGIISLLPSEIATSVEWIVLAVKTIGVIIIFYLILQLINLILNIRRNRKIDAMESKLELLNKKLNAVIDKLEKKKNRKN